MIRYMIMDVDGTLTDGKIFIGNDGEIMKAFSVKDGCGIHDILLPTGIIPIVITGRESRIVERRCKEIGISRFYQGVTDKLEIVLSITEDLSTIAYIGDDLNDLSCMIPIKESGGIIGCPADADKRVKDISSFISSNKGGDGAVREFIEFLVSNNSYFDEGSAYL